MQDLDALERTARESMGVLGRSVKTELRMLTELLGPGEGVRAMAIGQVTGVGPFLTLRLLVTTRYRFVALAKGLLTRRTRVEELPLGEIREVLVTSPSGLELVTATARVRYRLVQPPGQLSALADTIRDATCAPRVPELEELARRKLGASRASPSSRSSWRSSRSSSRSSALRRR